MDAQQSAAQAAVQFLEIKTESRERTYSLRSLTGLTYAVLAFGALNGLLALASIAWLAHQWQLLADMGRNAFASRAEMIAAAKASDALGKVLSTLFLITLYATNFVSCFWIYRAACNTRALGARRLQTSPGWAVGWFFVPFMWLYKPFGAIVEIWNGSASPEAWRQRPVPALLRYWWAAWISANLFGYVVWLIANAGKTIPSLIFATQATMLAMALNGLGVTLYLTVIWRIWRIQTDSPARANELAAAFS